MKHVEMIIDYVVDGEDFQYSDNHGVLIRCRDCVHNKSAAIDALRRKAWVVIRTA